MGSIKAKVILLGDGAVGKTSLIRRFVLDKYSDDYLLTIGTKITKKDVEVEHDRRKVQLLMTIWDILGQKGFAGVQESAAKGAQAAILAYDVTREETWRSLEEHWIPVVWRLSGKIPIVFAGNKADLAEDRGFAKDVSAYLTQRYEALGLLTSAKTGENVEALFAALGSAVLRSLEEPVERVATPTLPQHDVPPMLAVTDRIMTDFCASFGGLETGMNVVRQQFERARVDVRAPTREGLLKVVEFLAEVERAVKPVDHVEANRLKRISWVRAVP